VRRGGVLVLVALLLGALLLAGCAAPPQPRTLPYVVVLGISQDGGRPELGCTRECCTRGEPRRVASLVLVDPRTQQRWLIDATPDLREQMELVPARDADARPPKGRPPLFDGIFLTHVHMGHVTGLLQLGREAYAAEGQAVYASPSVCAFLEGNAPWKLLVSEQHVVLHPVDGPVELAPDLRITPIAVPHRAEFSDTHGFRIDGPRGSLLYIPDIDAWEPWDHDLAAEVSSVDVALLDGTFQREDELPGRSMEGVPHPLMPHTLELLPPELHGRVLFTHLNHTNTATQHVAQEGQVIGL